MTKDLKDFDDNYCVGCHRYDPPSGFRFWAPSARYPEGHQSKNCQECLSTAAIWRSKYEANKRRKALEALPEAEEVVIVPLERPVPLLPVLPRLGDAHFFGG